MAIKDKNEIIIQFMEDGIARDYDKSWDSLMLALDKIESLNMNLSGRNWEIDSNDEKTEQPNSVAKVPPAKDYFNK
jgi:effector-binding domain-containing protein